MKRISDHDLLREFAERGDEQAFAALLDRHLPLVYSTARRTLGDATLAQDISQQVFTLLARRAASLKSATLLSGWLYRTTRYMAGHTRRAEHRRVAREQLALAHMTSETTGHVWQAIEQDLDAAMETLSQLDRDAVVLRYFENRSLREVGQALGKSDDAAQKRLSRAVEKLRTYFCHRGRPVAAASLTAAISACAIVSPPSSMAFGISAAAIAANSLSTATTIATSTSLMNPLIKPFLVATAGIGAAAGLFYHHDQLSTQRAQNTVLQLRVAELESLAQTNPVESSSRIAQLSEAERSELSGLRGEVARLRREMTRAKAVAQSTAGTAQTPSDQDESNAPTSFPNLKPLQQHIELLKHVGLALRILCTDVDANPDLQAIKFTPGIPLPKEFLETLGPLASSLDQIDLLVPNVSWMLKAETQPDSIVARSRDAIPTEDGHFIRAYALGDGSVQSVRHTSAEEVFGWGQKMVNGKAVEWNLNSTPSVLILDPELARRYGLKVQGN